MNQKQYLSEERYQKVNKVFKTFYLILAIIGVGMIVGGIILLGLLLDIILKYDYIKVHLDHIQHNLLMFRLN